MSEAVRRARCGLTASDTVLPAASPRNGCGDLRLRFASKPPRRRRAADDTYLIRSVVHASEVLGAFQHVGDALRLRDVVDRTGYGKGLCYRVLHTLHHCGFLVRQGVHLVIEFQTDEAAALAIAATYLDAGIPLIAIDIPHPGATYFGADNYTAGLLAGCGGRLAPVNGDANPRLACGSRRIGAGCPPGGARDHDRPPWDTCQFDGGCAGHPRRGVDGRHAGAGEAAIP